MLVTSFDPKIVGSVITYFRRYELMAAAGLAPDDDDGDAASKATQARQPHIPPKAQSQQPKQEPEAIMIRKAVEAYLECLEPGQQERAFEVIRKGSKLAAFAISDLKTWSVENLRKLQANITKWEANRQAEPAEAAPVAITPATLTDEDKAAIDEEQAKAAKTASTNDDELDDPFADE
jgi:hypothetical protein